MYIPTEIQIGLEQTLYSMNEGETVEVCTVILGPEQIATGLQAYANLSAVPNTADGEKKLCSPITHYAINNIYVNRERLCTIHEYRVPDD